MTHRVNYKSVTSDTLIKLGPCVYHGAVVIVALSAATCEIRDAAAAGAGTVVDILPASAAIGTRSHPPKGVQMEAGLFVDFGGTGTVCVYYE